MYADRIRRFHRVDFEIIDEKRRYLKNIVNFTNTFFFPSLEHDSDIIYSNNSKEKNLVMSYNIMIQVSLIVRKSTRSENINNYRTSVKLSDMEITIVELFGKIILTGIDLNYV